MPAPSLIRSVCPAASDPAGAPWSDSLIAPLAALLDRVIPDPAERDRAKLALLDLRGSQELGMVNARLAGIVAEASSTDRWTSRARPCFLYLMYIIILWALPMGLIAAVNPAVATAIANGMTSYLASIPQPLYQLFGAGYLGYTAARQWGKVAGSDR
jgi:hypothetical protein